MTAALGTYFQAAGSIIDRFYTSTTVSIKTTINNVFTGGSESLTNSTETTTSTNLGSFFKPTTSNNIAFEPFKTTTTNTTTTDISYTINLGAVDVSGVKSVNLDGANKGAEKVEVSVKKGFLGAFFSRERNGNKIQDKVGVRVQAERKIDANTTVEASQEVGLELE
jgi:hypothetical protein